MDKKPATDRNNVSRAAAAAHCAHAGRDETGAGATPPISRPSRVHPLYPLVQPFFPRASLVTGKLRLGGTGLFISEDEG